jgi:hypothetical protein
MKHKVALILLGVSAFLGLNALSGCNAVLGIDQAEVESGGGTGKAGSTGNAGSTSQSLMLQTGSNACTVSNTACNACIANTRNCQQETNACLGDPDCRKAFDRYRYCLTKACDAKDCIERLYDDQPLVPSCIIQSCRDECAAVPVQSACQLYCACMAANCQSRFQDGTFSTMAACVTSCEQLPPDVQTCRRTHCEIAGDFPTERHCFHATGTDFCSAAGTTRPTTCTDKSLNSFACKADQECCSNNCNQDTRACSNP